jgi:hypothetical protein
MVEDVSLSPRDRALYEKLYVSVDDLGIALSCARYILKKKWHTYSFMRRGSVPLQQTAFTSTMIVSYCRAFSSGRGGKGNIELPKRLVQHDKKEAELHDRLLRLRNQEYAHTDASTIRVRPLKGDLVTSIQSIRDVCFSANELSLFIEMTDRLVAKIQHRLEEIRLSGC